MRETRVGFAVWMGLAVIAACSGANPNDLRALESPAIPVTCGSTSCASPNPFCCESNVSLDGAKAGGLVGTCLAAPSSCANATAVTQCDSSINCGGGQVCCRLVSSGITSQLCELTCAMGETQLCVSAADCVADEQCQIAAADGGAAADDAAVDSGGAPHPTGVCAPAQDAAADDDHG